MGQQPTAVYAARATVQPGMLELPDFIASAPSFRWGCWSPPPPVDAYGVRETAPQVHRPARVRRVQAEHADAPRAAEVKHRVEHLPAEPPAAVGLVHEHHADPADVAVGGEGGGRDELILDAAREAGVG